MLRLNMGCGSHHLSGHINVDKYPPADIVFDLENTNPCAKGVNGNPQYWPWDDNSVDEVLFHHSLEHMGSSTEGFLHIIKELWRVCKNGAAVTITVPHPRHDDFINDPTHVRPITPMILELFNKENNEAWASSGAPNTPLAMQLGVDFLITSCTACIEEEYAGMPNAATKDAMTKYNNVIKFMTFVWQCRK